MQAIFSLGDLAQNLLQILSFKQFGINALDLIIIGVIAFYTYEGYVLGFLLASVDFLSFILSFLLGLLLFDFVAQYLVQLFSLPQGFANAISFFLVAFVSELSITFLFRLLLRRVPSRAEKLSAVKFLRRINRPLGIFPGLASAYVILSFILTVIIALPSSPILKQLVTQSKLGGSLISHTASVQHALSEVFGGAIEDTLNVMTVKPQSDETVNLHFTVANPTTDEEAERQMLALVNSEREARGLSALRPDSQLRDLARSYASDMLKRGYFSHFNPEGLSPFDRMDQAGVRYGHAGENLALAPSTKLAHQGLMNSTGHRANILSPSYRKVGIGVMDGGIYGKMFVQEFTD